MKQKHGCLYTEINKCTKIIGNDVLEVMPEIMLGHTSSGSIVCNWERRAVLTLIGNPWYSVSLILGGRQVGRDA